MNQTIPPRIKTSSFAIGLLLALLALGPTTFAANRTWIDTPADGNWSNPVNWDAGLAPVSTDAVIFTNSAITSVTNDLPSLFLRGIAFTSGGDAFTLWGNPFTIDANIANLSANAQVINMDATLNFDRVLTGTPNFTFGGLFLNSGGNRAFYHRLNGGTLFLNNVTLSEAAATARTLTIIGGPSGAEAAANTTISGVVANGSTASSTLNYFGTGTLRFNGAAASTHGNSSVTAGTLLLDFANLSPAENLLNAASTLTLGGGTYSILGKSSGATAQTNGNLTLTANTGNGITLNNNGGAGTTLRLGNLGGRGGNSTLHIDTSAGGTLVVGSTPAVANGILNPAYATIKDATGTGFATTSGNAIVRYTGATPLANNSDSATVNFSYAADGTTFNWNGVGSRSVNSLAIDTTANSGVLDLGGTANVLTNSSRAILMSGANNFTIQNGQVGSAGVEQIIHVAGPGALTVSASVGSGAASLTKGGVGTLVLSGVNTYSGVTAVAEGTLKQSGVNGLGATNASLQVGAGGVMDLNGFDLAVGQLGGNGGGIIVNNGASAATLTIGSGNVANSGTTLYTIIDGASPLTLKKVGSGQLQISGASSWSGGTLVTGGNPNALRVNNSAGLGTGPVTLNDGGIFTPSANPMAGGNGQTLPNNIIAVGNSANNVLQGDISSFTWAGNFSGSGTVKVHNGTRTGHNAVFSGDFSAFTGTFNVAHGAASSTYQARLLQNGSATAKFSLTTAGSQISFNGTGEGGTNVALGELSGISGTRLSGDTAAKTFTIGALGTSSTFNGAIENGNAVMSVTKVGAGTLTLGAAATYTGSTVVSNGLLFVSGLSSPSVNVYAPGAFGGSGSVLGPVILSAGNAGLLLTNGSTGTLFVGDGVTGLTLDSGNLLAFDIGANPTSDSVSVSGAFAQTGTATIYIGQAAGFGAGTFTLISGATGISAANFTLGNSISGYVMSLSDDGFNLYLTITVSAPPAAFWHNRSGTAWNVANNWDTDEFSGIALSSPPSSPTDVTFASSAASSFNTTLGANLSIHNLEFKTPSAVTVGGANTLTIGGNVLVQSGAGNPTISASGVALGVDQTWTVTDAGQTLAVSAPVSGAKALAVAGAGTVALSGNNSYSGGTLIQGGATLALNHASDTLLNAGPVAIENGTLNIGANTDIVGAVALTNGAIAGTSGVLTGSVYYAENGSISAKLGGSAAFTKQTGGTVQLSGANTYSGGTVLADGVLQVGNATALGSGGVNLFSATATLDLNGNSIANALNATAAGTVANTSGSAAALTTDVTVNSPFTIDTTGNITMARLISSASRTVTKNGTGTLTFNGAGHNNLVGLIVNDGVVVCGNTGGYSTDRGTTLNNGLIQLAGPGLGAAPNANLINDNEFFTFNSGTFDLNGWNETVAAVNGTGGVMLNNLTGTTNTVTVGGNNTTGSWDGTLQNGSSVLALAKIGSGSQTLTAESTYSGNTTVSGGTLALTGSGSISNSAVISVGAGAILDVTGRTDGALTLKSGQTLTGGGTVDGNVVAPVGSTVNPGATVGTLTVSGSIALQGTLRMDLNRTAVPNCDSLVSSASSITYSGTLVATNLGAALQVGDTFQLFPSAVTTFSAIQLATTDATGNLYTWNNNVAVNGSISVATVTPPVPPVITNSVAGNTLTLSWPSAYSTWTLQTNAVSVTASGSWFAHPGTPGVSSVNITIDPAKTNVFFRLRAP